MIIFKKTISIILFLLNSFIINAQELKVGQSCPDILLKNIINFSSDQLNLSDIKGKLIIVDFWATTCISCIKAFPHMDSLQKLFNDKIQIIAVNSESKDSTIRFFDKRKRIKIPAFPFVTGDSIMSVLFPHIFVPHHVWIDSNRIVQAITEGFNTTAENLTAYFSNDFKLNLPLKKDTLLKYSDAIFWPGQLGESQGTLEYCSYLTKGIVGLPSGNGFNNTIDSERNDDANMIYADNIPISTLIDIAFSERNKYNFEHSNSVILNVQDPSRFSPPKDNNKFDEWLKSNPLYCYRLLVPPSEKKELFVIMQQDLKRYFNIDVKIKKKLIKCLVLKRTSPVDKLKSKGGRVQNNFSSIDPKLYAINTNFEEFVEKLKIDINYNNSIATPFINATNYKGKIDININNVLSPILDIPALRNELQKYNLNLVSEDYLTDVLIINEKKRYK